MLAICFIICFSFPGAGREKYARKYSAGIDIASAIRERALNVKVGREIASHWSLDASNMIILSRNRSGLAHEYEEHYETLYEWKNDQTDTDSDIIFSDITLSYWLKECYKGLFLHAGCRSYVQHLPQVIIGVGYSVVLWQELTFTLSCNTSVTNKAESAFGLTISYTL